MTSLRPMITVRRSIQVLVLFVLLSTVLQAADYLQPSERKWLQQQESKLEVLFGYEAPPNAYRDDKGRYVGLLVDFLREIESHLRI